MGPQKQVCLEMGVQIVLTQEALRAFMALELPFVFVLHVLIFFVFQLLFIIIVLFLFFGILLTQNGFRCPALALSAAPVPRHGRNDRLKCRDTEGTRRSWECG